MCVVINPTVKFFEYLFYKMSSITTKLDAVHPEMHFKKGVGVEDDWQSSAIQNVNELTNKSIINLVCVCVCMCDRIRLVNMSSNSGIYRS